MVWLILVKHFHCSDLRLVSLISSFHSLCHYRQYYIISYSQPSIFSTPHNTFQFSACPPFLHCFLPNFTLCSGKGFSLVSGRRGFEPASGQLVHVRKGIRSVEVLCCLSRVICQQGWHPILGIREWRWNKHTYGVGITQNHPQIIWLFSVWFLSLWNTKTFLLLTFTFSFLLLHTLLNSLAIFYSFPSFTLNSSASSTSRNVTFVKVTY